jgi:hypothetical protein
MANIPLAPTDPDILVSLPDYVAGSAIDFATRLQSNQDALEARDRQNMAAAEGLAGAIGFGWLSGGTISAGAGASVSIAALTAIVGTPVGFTTSQVVAVNLSVTNYIFLRQDWTWTVPAAGSSTVPLSSDGHGAAMLWGTATCDGSGVTAVSNVRKSFLQRISRMPLMTADPADASSGDVWGRTDTTTIHVQGLGTFSTSGGGGSGNVSYIGVYDNTHTYAANDLVIGSDNLGYIAKGSTLGHAPPNATYWQPIGSQGATGATGPAGPTGPAFSPILNWLGSWSSGATYNAYDMVEYSGSSYIAIATGINQNPSTATSYWHLIASKGDAGAAGSAGAAGAKGSAWLPTTGIPGGGTGNNGDYALDAATGDVYLKAAGSWGYQGNLRGLQGTTGLQGPTGGIAGSVQSIPFVLNNGSSALAAGQYVDIPCEWAGTINAVRMLADASGSVVIDIRKCTYSQFDDSAHPVSGDSICASAKPTISTATKSLDTTITGWTTTFSAGDILRAVVVSATTIKQCTVSLRVVRS